MLQNKYIRYFFGFVLLFIILLCFNMPHYALAAVSFLFIYAALTEYDLLFKKNNIFIYKHFAGMMSCLAAFVFVYADENFYELSQAVLLISFIIPFAITILKNQKPYIKTSLCTSCFVFFVFCGLHIIKIYNYMPDLPLMLLTYFGCVLFGDYAASITGPKVKKRVLIAPEISPNKTFAGAAANLIISCIIAAAASHYINLSIFEGFLFGMIVSVSAQFGDLAVSCFKRELGADHSSSFFFDYGGVLDRMDSFIFSAPAVCCFLYNLN